MERKQDRDRPGSRPGPSYFSGSTTKNPLAAGPRTIMAPELQPMQVSPSFPSTCSSSQPSSQNAPFHIPDLEKLTPYDWNLCYDSLQSVAIPSSDLLLPCYSVGPPLDQASLIVVLAHGGGHSSMSWAFVAKELAQQGIHCIAFDARQHGSAKGAESSELTLDVLVQDLGDALEMILNKVPKSPKLVMVGHSLGGCTCIKLAASYRFPNLAGLIVLDVVEGSAMESLPYMSAWLEKRPKSFPSIPHGIRYVLESKQVRNVESARLSVPPQLVLDPANNHYIWRTNLFRCEPFWQDWFRGLSKVFLSVPVPKLLIIAGDDRLDRDLTIGQMQGKFQAMIIPGCGHQIQEDNPADTAAAIIKFLNRNKIFATDNPMPHETGPLVSMA